MEAINPHIGVDIDTFIKKHLRLIHKIANRFTNRLKRTSFVYDDLFSIAAIGFTKAYKKFDPEAYINPETGKGVQFSTYAVPMMVGEIQRYFRDENLGISYPRSVKELAQTIWKQDLIDLTPKEILNILKNRKFNTREIQLNDVKTAIEFIIYSTPLSANEVVYEDGEDQDITLQDMLPMSTTADYTSVYVKDFLSTLDSRMRKVVELTMDAKTQAEIGKVIGVSQVQVSRLLRKVGELYIEHLEQVNKDKPKLTTMEQVIQDYAAREVAVSIEEEVTTVPKGDLTLAKKLLKETTLGYREISKITGCTLSVISGIAKTDRPAEVREQNNPFTATATKEKELTLTGWDGTEIKLKDEQDLEAATLLLRSRMSYGDIAKKTKLDYGRVGYLGPKFRSPELRKELQAEHSRKHLEKKGTDAVANNSNRVFNTGTPASGNRDAAVQMLAQGGFTYKEIETRTGVPAGSLTKLKKEYEAGRYQWEKEPVKTVAIKEDEPIETPVINEPVFMGDKDRAAMEQKNIVAAAKPLEPKIPAKTIAEAVEEFKQEIRKEVEEEMKAEQPTFTTAVEPHVEMVDISTPVIQAPVVAEFEATPKAPRRIRRKMTVEADGTEVTASEALVEVEEIYNMLKNMNGDKMVSFMVKVHA